MATTEGITIIIPTCNGGEVFCDCLRSIGRQRYSGAVQLIVVDSGSTDGTVAAAEKAGALIKRIDPGEFHHARTRNMAVPLAVFGAIIFMVQDAVPNSDNWLSGMARGLEDDCVAAAFAAHLPHDDATPYARFENDCIARIRLEASVFERLQSLEMFKKMPYDTAYKSVALDNVCAVYRKELLEETPFPDVGFAEDLAWGLKISLSGHRIAYLPHVQVRHSHDRPPDYAFRRQIVNSYWVARIMDRVREDLSHLSLGDLMSVTRAVRMFALRQMEKRQFCLNRAKGEGFFIDRILKRYPLSYRIWPAGIHRLLPTRLGGPSFEINRIAQQANLEIGSRLESIENVYSPKDGDEWLQTLEQIVANALGRIYGEVYAGGILKGRVSRSIETFIRPFVSGV